MSGDARQRPSGTGTDPSVMYRSLLRTAIVMAVFTVVVTGLMFGNTLELRRTDPRRATELKIMKAKLHRSPRDEALKASVRETDLRLRQAYVRGLRSSQTGGYVLLLAVAGLVAALAGAAHYRTLVPQPSLKEATDRLPGMLERRAVSVVGSVALVGFVALAVASRGDLSGGYARAVKAYRATAKSDFTVPAPRSAPTPAGKTVPSGQASDATTGSAVLPTGKVGPLPPLPVPTGSGAPTQSSGGAKPAVTGRGIAVEAAFDASDYSPSAAEYAANWPVFRGPESGIASGGYPSEWDGKSGRGILWKTAIPLPGWNSPVVWGDRVFLAGADKNTRTLYCLDASDGKLLWQVSPGRLTKAKAPDVNDETGYAAPTLAVDGKRVFAIFPDGDVFGYGFDGKQLWGRNLGEPDSMYGYASSLTTFRSLVIVQYDHGSGDDGRSALVALQGATGKVVWVAKRPVAASWSSPIVARTGDTGIVITCANPWTIAYDALSGRELWRANLLSGDVAPSPAYHGSTAYVCNTGSVLAAIRADGSGDVTKSHVSWQASDGLPDITSPATDGKLVYLITTEGMATCYDAANGAKVWEHNMEASFRASPVIVGGNVFMTDVDGVTHVLDAGRAFRQVAKHPLGEQVNATPAFSGGRIFIRGANHLYCIGAGR